MTLKTIRKGKEWFGKLFGAVERASRGATPAVARRGPEDSPADSGPAWPPVPYGSAISDPIPVDRPVPAPADRGSDSSMGLQVWIRSCAELRRSVEAEMLQLCRTYRSSIRPCRLQLFAWSSPKGSPPKVVNWVRLSRKRNEFHHTDFRPAPVNRPRWFKVLRIRTRRDLDTAIHCCGLDRHRRAVMSFYDSRQALNKSRSILANAMRYATLALKGHLESSGPGREAQPDLLRDPTLPYLDGATKNLFVMALKIGRLVEGDLIALEELRKRTDVLPVRLVFSEDSADFDRVVRWEYGPSKRTHRVLFERSLKLLQLSPADLAAVRLAISECRVLLPTLSRRLKIIRGAEGRLARARVESDRALERHHPRPSIPGVPGYCY